MSYGYLPSSLEPVADAARSFMRNEWGISDARIQVEQPIDRNISPGPTFQAPHRDHHIVCVEVASSAYPRSLGSVIILCMNRSLPILFYVAIYESDAKTEDIANATEAGVGVLLLDRDGVLRKFASAQSLSLVGVRESKPASWPPKYRHRIALAYDTFKNGDPSKGCSLLFDEIEGVTRRICVKAARKRAWRNLPANAAIPDASNVRVPLAQIAKFMYDYFDPRAAGAPELDNVFGTVVGAVSPRNTYAHPQNFRGLQRRDMRARTQFESAADILHDLVKGAAPLRV